VQPPIFFVEPHLLGTLDATEGTHLVRDLLLGEARRLGVPIHRVVISLNITVADGGIDAKVEATPAASSLLIQGESHFQIKTGESFKPWQPAAINTELFGQGRAPTAENLGPAIRTCLERDGLYSLITMGHDLTAQQHSDAVAELQSAFRQCGFANAKAEVIGQGQLASLLQQYPSLCQRIKHQDLRCQTIQSWSSDADMQAGLALGEKQQAFIDQLTLAIVSAEIQHVRVVGEPGIGKSRLVLEAFKQSDSLAATSLYFRQATEFQRSPLFNELLKVGFDGYVIVIADECEESDRTQMWSVLKGRRHVKLITIDHGPAAPSSDPTVLTLELPALDPKETMAILQSYMPQGEGLDRWAAYCEGSARVAHAVGENLKQNPDDLLRSPSDVPVWQRFVLGYNRMDDAQARQYQTVMRHIALFHKFGFLPPVEVEGQYIAKLVQDADPSITPQRFSEITRHFVKRRILQGNHTLRIVPRMLHVHLWREWWDNYGAGVNLDVLLKGMPKGMQHWFLQLFVYAHDLPGAKPVIRQVLSPNGLFSDKELLSSKNGGRFISALAEADPGSTLDLIQATVGRWSDEEISAWQERSGIMSALEKIAVWQEHFTRAAKLLARLAFNEKSTYSNNSRGTLLGLFSWAGATQASLSKRVDLASAFLDDQSAHLRSIGLDACKAVLDPHSWGRIVGVENQGLRAEIEFWRPTCEDDISSPLRRALALLVLRAGNGAHEEQRTACAHLLEVCQAQLYQGNLEDEVLSALEGLRENSACDRRKLVQTVATVIHHKGLLSDEGLLRLGKLESALVGTTFQERLVRYVFCPTEQDDYTFVDGQVIKAEVGAQEIGRLAGEAIAAEGEFDLLLPQLLAGDSNKLLDLGMTVAQAAKDGRFDSAILGAAQQHGAEAGSYFLRGYLCGVKGLDAARWEKAAMELLETAEQCQGIVDSVVGSGWSSVVLDRLLVLYKAGQISSFMLRFVGLTHDNFAVPLDQVVKVLEALTTQQDKHSNETAIFIANGRLCKPGTEHLDKEELLYSILSDRQVLDESLNHMNGYYWHELVTRFRARFPARDLDLLHGILQHPKKLSGIRELSYVSQTADLICADHPAEAWPMVAEGLGLDTGGYAFRAWLGDPGGFSRPAPSTMSVFPVDAVLDWVAVDPKDRLWKLIDMLPQSVEPGPGGELTRRVIERFGSHEDVHGHLIARFSAGGFTGPRSAHYATEREAARDWLTQASSLAVQDWLEEYIRVLDQRIEDAKINEERGYF
jgi:hypothetical protein